MLRLRLDRAVEICRETIGLGTHWGGAGAHPYTALAFILLGQVMYEWNDLDGAERELDEGLRLAEASFNWAFLLRARLLMARLSQAKGDAAAALEYLRRAEELAPRAPQAREGRQVAVEGALLALRQGDLAGASDWERRHEADLPLSRLPGYPQELAYLTMVRVKLAQHKCSDLPAYLDRFARNAQDQGRTAAVLEALILNALALGCLGEAARPEETLGRALSLGEPAGCVRTFVDEGEPMANLLARIDGMPPPAAAARFSQKYVRQLLAAFPATGHQQPTATHHSSLITHHSLVEPLSERELEVLRLIAAGRSNKEVASRLVLAIGTVKKHTSNIFGKLNVESRTRAIARARELGIIWSRVAAICPRQAPTRSAKAFDPG